MCGEEKVYYNGKQKFCRECASVRAIEQRRYGKTWKHRRDTIAKAPQNTLEDVVDFATKHNVSYGKAVLLFNL